MKVANIILVRSQEEKSPIVTATYPEEVRGFKELNWTPTHVVFLMEDDTFISYRADRVWELSTIFE